MKELIRLQKNWSGRNEKKSAIFREDESSKKVYLLEKEEYVFFDKWDLHDQTEKFYYTEGIDIDSNDYIYVTDEGYGIRKFDRNEGPL